MSIDSEFADTTVGITVVKAWPERRAIIGENTGMRLNNAREVSWFTPEKG